MSLENNLNRTQLLSFSNPFVASVATILYLFLEDVLDGADDDADDAAKRTQDDGFNKKLADDMVIFGPDRFTQPNFTGAFRHRYQRDIHDADTTHDQ